MIKYPKELEKIFTKLQQENIRAIIVGGYLRDAFLKRDSKDIDIELYGIDSLQKIEELLEEFGDVNKVGKSFGVVKLLYNGLDLDFSLPRKDSKIAKGHKGFEVSINSSLSFEEASRRRDFTMNAIGYDVVQKRVLDPHGGIEDIKNKIIRAVDLEKFDEDPLRVLRAVGFASRFDFTIEKNLYKKCQKMIEQGSLEQLPKERIFTELQKMLLKSKKPSKAFFLLRDFGAFGYFKEFLALSKEEQEALFFALNRAPKDLLILFAVLIYNFSAEEKITFLQRVTQDKKFIQSLFKLASTPLSLESYSDYDLYKIATKVKISDLSKLLSALYPEKKELVKKMVQRAKDLNIYEKELPHLLRGKDLIDFGIKPSKEFSKILNSIYEAQMRGEVTSKKEALGYLDRLLILT